ncbi:uncharacterized protein LOC123313132 [Coccinella septempunctata]|uniref:uncharacterized protein LOC123313132 n=1 Tax=Coccinella septempunctata TaxID=41139 RepID=UPI001D0709FD|nr:uncharacterized protein LOC123313132 [Coccinella septempunctata]
MDEIINQVKSTKGGYALTTGIIKIICFADDALIIAENEDDLQRLLNAFYVKAKNLNMQISITKAKTLIVSKEPVRCKLSLENKVMSFDYLGIQITSSQNRTNEVNGQVNKASRISGALRDIIWNNAFMNKKAKVRIYKTCVRPVLTYAIETRADNKKTKNIIRTTEVKILRNISGYTLRDRKRNTDIRHECQVEDIVRWGRTRRRAWNDHVDRMTTGRLAKIARDGIPRTRRPLRRPPKRWMDSWSSMSQEN